MYFINLHDSCYPAADSEYLMTVDNTEERVLRISENIKLHFTPENFIGPINKR